MAKAKVQKRRLTGSLSLPRARELHEELEEWLDGGGPIEVDCSDVTELDAAGLQLLLSLRAALPKHGLRLHDLPPEVETQLRLFGAYRQLVGNEVIQ